MRRLMGYLLIGFVILIFAIIVGGTFSGCSQYKVEIYKHERSQGT